MQFKLEDSASPGQSNATPQSEQQASGEAADLLHALPETVRKPLFEKVKATFKGYELFTVLLGQDPIDGHRVPMTAKAIVRGALILLPDGEETYETLEKQGHLDRIGSLLKNLLEKHGLSVSYITAALKRIAANLPTGEELVEAGKSLFWAALNPRGEFKQAFKELLERPWAKRLWNAVIEPFQKIIAFSQDALPELGRMLLDIALELAGPVGATLRRIFNKGRDVSARLLQDPLGFVKNVFSAAALGIKLFGQNALKHVTAKFQEWIMLPLRARGLIPERLDLEGVLSAVVAALGLSYEKTIRPKLLEALGDEKRLAALESGVARIISIIQSIPGLWEQAKGFYENLQRDFWGTIQNFLTKTLVEAAVKKLAGLLIPGGAIVQAVSGIYSALQVIKERIEWVLTQIEDAIDSVSAILDGKLDAAAARVEGLLANAIPTVLDILGKVLFGKTPGEVVDQLLDGLRKFTKPFIDKAVAFLIKKAEPYLNKLADVVTGTKHPMAVPFDEGDEHHELWLDTSGTPQAMVSSESATPLRQFIAHLKDAEFRKTYKISDAQLKKLDGKVDELDAALKQVPSSSGKKGKSGAANQDSDKLAAAQQVEIEVSSLLGEMLKGKTTKEKLEGDLGRFELEGTIGEYGSMAGLTGDQLDKDHQPANSLLQYVYGKLTYSVDGKSKKVFGKASEGTIKSRGFAINLGMPRHAAGRTHSLNYDQFKPSPVQELDRIKTKARTGGSGASTSAQDNAREEAKAVLRTHAKADAAHMRKVIDKKPSNPIFEDVAEALAKSRAKQKPSQAQNQLAGQEDKELKGHVDAIRARIELGEKEVENQIFPDD